MVTRLTAEYPVKRVCQVLDYLRSSYGGPSKGREEQLRREAIAGVAAAWPPDGIAVSRRNCDARAGS